MRPLDKYDSMTEEELREHFPNPGPIYPLDKYYIQQLETVAQMAADIIGILAPGIIKLCPSDESEAMAVSLTDARLKILRVLGSRHV
jgi:hypothetical protein